MRNIDTGDANRLSLPGDVTRLPDSGTTGAGNFSILFDKASFAVALSKASNGALVDVNDTWVKLFGYTRQEAIGKTTLELNINPDSELRAHILAQLQESGSAHNLEMTLRTKSGEWRNFLTDVDEVEINGQKYLLNTVQDITERKRAEGQLRYQATLLSNVNDAIVASDSQFRLTGWNAAAEALYGWKAEEVIGRNGLEVARTEWPEKDAEEMRQRIAEVGYWRGEATQARKDGSRFPVEISSFVLHDEIGQITGYVSVNRDITERKRAEDQLRELSQRLTYHVDNSPLAVIEWGPDMRLIRWSAAAERMFGWKAKEVLGKRIEDLRWVYEEDTEQVKKVATDLRTGTNPQRFSANRNYRKDGSVVYSEWYNSSLVDEAGNLRSILSLVLDVTDRRRAEQELMQSEERYRHLVKYAPTGIYEIDIKTMRFLEVNESMCQILGYTREELLSRTPGELLDEEGRQRFRERMLKMLAREEVSPQAEYLVRAKDGHEIWGLLTTTINYDQGKPTSVSVVAHDITERKRQEELSRALNFVNDSIHSTLDLNEVMQRAMDQAANALGCDTAAVSLREGNTWIVRYVHGMPPDVVGMQTSDDQERHAVLAVQTKRPVAVNDAFNEEQFNREHFRKWSVRSILVVPLLIRGEARGVIFFNYQRSQNIFTDYQIDFAVKLSASLSLALENARLLGDLRTELAERIRAEDALRQDEEELRLLNETLEQKVHEKTAEVHGLASDLIKATQRERQRISHVLHDDLQQRIYAIQMQLAFLRDGLPVGNELAASEVSDIEKELSDILKMTRDLSIDLSPPILRDEGLAHAIDWLANRMRGQYGLPIELQADGSFVISNEELHVLVFNCVRELLFNVVKHAEASQALVVLQWCGGDLRIEVRDEGQGFAVSSPAQQISGGTDVGTGLGLPTIRHQLSLFGGRMEIQSEPGVGTRVVLTVPVKDPAD